MRINPIYHEKGALHISEIDATSNHLIPICDCDIFVFQDGTIEIYDNENNLFEHCFIWDILQENHFNLDMSLKFKNKNFRITFPNKESKIHFCDILEKNTYILIKKALSIAKKAHFGQVDRSGIDYIFHPITVALLCETPQEKTVALLHDTLEDCPDQVNYEMLVNEVGKDIADAVFILTHDKNKSTYLEYVQSIKDSKNKLAIAVKKADLIMNMDLARIENPTKADDLRIEQKYKPALAILDKQEN